MFWNSTLLAARGYIYRGDWAAAVPAYGQALELADILLNTDKHRSGALDRYSRTATEFIYALRKSGDQQRLDPFLLEIVGRFERMDTACGLDELIGPVLQAARRPADEVDLWIEKIIGMEKVRRQHLH